MGMRWSLCLASALFVIGCGAESAEVAPLCGANETQACQCLSDGAYVNGLQTCTATGEGWTPCACEGGAPEPTPDAGQGGGDVLAPDVQRGKDSAASIEDVPGPGPDASAGEIGEILPCQKMESPSRKVSRSGGWKN